MTTQQKLRIFCLAAFVCCSSFSSMPAASAYTQADLNEVRSKISDLRNQISSYEAEASRLAAQADTLSNRIASLQNEQANLRAQIELKEAEHEQIVADIEIVQQRINDNSNTIGYIVAQYYYNENVSTLERIAASESFSSFVDEEVRLGGISDTLSEIIEENKNLEADLQNKKHDAELILQDLDSQKQQLIASEAEASRLLAETRSNEAAYQSMKQTANSERIALEEKQQDILNELYARNHVGGVTAGDPSKGGYPYSGYCPQQKDAFADRWGMYICECVSYTAWRVYNAYGYMPNWAGRGNANQWISNARSAGYTVSSTPKVGAVGISMAGYYGHAVWVEAVSGSRVYISQYNYRNAATGYRAGEYSEQWIDAGAYQYIYFR